MEHLLSPREQVCWPARQEEWMEFKQAGLLGKGRATQRAPSVHPASSVLPACHTGTAQREANGKQVPWVPGQSPAT